MMEHRLDTRIEAPMEVTIHTDFGDTLQTRANNLSRGGMSIELATAGSLKEKKLVLVEFMEERLTTKIPALVIQTSGITASLMFIEHSPELHAFLSDRRR
jgi:c-di-GMP-binding flagellar brake protein YcgR